MSTVPIKVASLSTTDLGGGAARAAFRLQQGLLAQGAAADLIVQRRFGAAPFVQAPSGHLGQLAGQFYPYLDALPKLCYRHRQRGPWTTGLFPNPFLSDSLLRSADLIHLHWVSEGFLPITSVGKLGRPIVWTLHDMATFTGGCHYAGDCRKFTQRCGACPQLGSVCERDLSRWTYKRKARAWAAADITLVCPSRWMARETRSSSLFAGRDIQVIPNGLDLALYRPIDRSTARSLLRLPQDRPLALTAAMNVTGDRRKGYAHLAAALRSCREDALPDLELLVLGDAGKPGERPGDEGVRFLGSFADDLSMVLACSAADLFVAPSEQDNLPNTVMEAMACAVPVVAFDVGGLTDLVSHDRTGLLVEARSAERLAEAMTALCRDPDRRLAMGAAGRVKAEQEYELSVIAQRHLALYRDLLEDRRGRR